MAQFKAVYGRKCRSPLCWNDAAERRLFGPELVTQTTDKVKVVIEHLKAA